MSSNQNFAHDVYISYAEPDNRNPSGGSGWVDLLHERLSTFLGQELGDEPNIWREGHQGEWDGVISEGVTNSRLLLAVITPQCVQSEWFHAELAAFQERNPLMPGSLYRVFKVVKTPLPNHLKELEPTYTRNLLGYNFYERDETSGLMMEFSPDPSGPDANKRYWKTLDRLVTHMTEALREVRLSEREASSRSREASPTLPVAPARFSELEMQNAANTFRARTLDRSKSTIGVQKQEGDAHLAQPKDASISSTAHQVFISYANADVGVAREVRAALEAEGVKCWIAADDILPSEIYGRAIIKAINSSRLLLVVFTANTNASKHVETEIDRAYNKDKPIILLRIEEVNLSESLEYYLSTGSWLNALEPPLNKHLPELVGKVKRLFS